MESQQQTQVVDLDISKLIEDAKAKFPTEKEPEITPEDVLKRISMDEDLPKVEIEEVKKEEEAPKEKEEVKAEPQKRTPKTHYDSKLKSLIEDGLIEDFQVAVGEGENEKLVFLSELEKVDEDTYKYILSTYKETKKKEIDDNYISKEGIDELTESLIQLKKEGGDITSIIKEELQYVDVLQKMKSNIDDEQQQIDIVFHELKRKGLSDRVIQAQINDLTENFELEKTAVDILDGYIAGYNQSIEEKKKEQLDRISKDKEKEKQFKKEVSTFYKTAKIPDNIKNILLENTTKRDENGLTNTDKLYFDSINDPEKHAKIAFFLHNQEAFEKWISSSKVLQSEIKSALPLMRINTKVIKKESEAGSPEVDNILNKLRI